MIPVIILAVIAYPPFVAKYPLCKVVASSWQAFLPYQLAYGVYMFSWEFFFRGFMLFGLERKFGNYTLLIQDDPICSDALFKAVTGGTRFNHCGCIARDTCSGNALIYLWSGNSLACRNDNGCSGCHFSTFLGIKSHCGCSAIVL